MIFRQEDMKTDYFRQEDIIFLLTGSYGTNLGGYGVSP